MKAPRFAYARPASVAEALALLAEHKGDARVLAGGQSLVPMMNFRLAAPKVLVDINRIAALTGIKVARNHLRIGALALGATFVVAKKKGERRIAAEDFFKGLYATALKAGELIVAAEFPLPKPGYASAFGELARRHGDYAMVGIAAHGSRKGGKFSDMRVAFFGVGDRPQRATGLEKALEGRSDVDGALARLDADLAPRGDLHASAAMKLHLAKVLAGRVLGELAA